MAGRNYRAPGPDGLCNEHIKQTMTYLLVVWKELLITCLKEGMIPNAWRKSTMKLLYKDKSDTSDP